MIYHVIVTNDMLCGKTFSENAIYRWVWRLNVDVVDFQLYDVIPTPLFQFGGAVGSKETVLILQRRTDR